jgi:hypothetical protein
MKNTAGRLVLGVMVLVVIFAGVMTGGYVELRRQNRELRLGLERVEREQKPAESIPPQKEPLASAEKLELMRLRNEVTQLRASVTAAKDQVKRALENRERATRQGGPGAMTEEEARESGKVEFKAGEVAFRGFATPEDGFISALAAMKEGDISAMQQVMTPEESARWAQLNAGKTGEELQTRFHKEFGTNSTLRIAGQEQVSPTEVVLDVEMERPYTKRVRMNLVDNEWKAGAPINQNKNVAEARDVGDAANSYDPLSFYRKNPELMKRYFPHLYQQQQSAQAMQAQPGTGQGTLPPEPAPNE